MYKTASHFFSLGAFSDSGGRVRLDPGRGPKMKGNKPAILVTVMWSLCAKVKTWGPLNTRLLSPSHGQIPFKGQSEISWGFTETRTYQRKPTYVKCTNHSLFKTFARFQRYKVVEDGMAGAVVWMFVSPPPPKLTCWNLIPSVMAFWGRAFGGCLCHADRSLCK